MEQLNLFDSMVLDGQNPEDCVHKIKGAAESNSCMLPKTVTKCPCTMYDKKLSCEGCRHYHDGFRVKEVCYPYRDACKRYWHATAHNVDARQLKDKYERE